MGSYYGESHDLEVLKERIEELSRIRQGFAAHLGNSLYEATKDNEELRWGRESLYDGISACDAERERILQRIAKLSEPRQEERKVEEEPVAVDSRPQETPDQPRLDEFEDGKTEDPLRCAVCGSEVKATDKFCMGCGARLEHNTSQALCPHCGSPVEEGFVYCMVCGHRLD